METYSINRTVVVLILRLWEALQLSQARLEALHMSGWLIGGLEQIDKYIKYQVSVILSDRPQPQLRAPLATVHDGSHVEATAHQFAHSGRMWCWKEHLNQCPAGPNKVPGTTLWQTSQGGDERGEASSRALCLPTVSDMRRIRFVSQTIVLYCFIK